MLYSCVYSVFCLLFKLCMAINEALAKHFPPALEVKVVAEPGRYFATKTTSIYTTVIGKKVNTGIIAKSKKYKQIMSQIKEFQKASKHEIIPSSKHIYT